MSGAKFDSWRNLFTGQGVAGVDKRQYTTADLEVIDADTAERIYRGNDIGARMVDIPVEDALRNGFDFVASLEGDGDSRGSSDDVKDLQTWVESRWEELGLIEAIREAWTLERSIGGAVVYIGTEDTAGDDKDTVLDDDTRVREVTHLTVFDTQEARGKDFYSGVLSEKFGEPSRFRIQAYPDGSARPEDSQVAREALIHRSRVLYFPGIKLRRRGALSLNDGFGDSIYTRAWPVLRDFGTAWDSTGNIMSEFASATMTLKGLAELLTTDGGTSAVLTRLRVLNLARSSFNTALIDEDESYQRNQTPVTGLADILREYNSRLSSACGGIPITKIFGMSPGGLNASGDSDIAQWDDRVKHYQTHKVIPLINRVTELLLQERGVSEKFSWQIEARPLRNPTDAEIAEARKIQAEADKIYLESSVLDPDDVAESRFGGESYSYHTTIDWARREKIEREAQQAAEELAQETAQQIEQVPADETAELAATPGEE